MTEVEIVDKIRETWNDFNNGLISYTELVAKLAVLIFQTIAEEN
jgi:hypothetical protein